jgi:Uma2 family endonuclease
MEALTIDFSKVNLTDEQFYYLCRQNEVLRFEMNAEGEVIVMSPVGGESGRRELSLGAKVWMWNDSTGLGEAFSSSTMFILPNGAKRSPDVAWIEKSRWSSLPVQAQEKFIPLAPDFVIELRSRTDDLATLQTKMQEYLANAVQLGWLINPQDQEVEIYELGKPVVTLALPTTLPGGTLMPGFSLAVPRF